MPTKKKTEQSPYKEPPLTEAEILRIRKEMNIVPFGSPDFTKKKKIRRGVNGGKRGGPSTILNRCRICGMGCRTNSLCARCFKKNLSKKASTDKYYFQISKPKFKI